MPLAMYICGQTYMLQDFLEMRLTRCVPNLCWLPILFQLQLTLPTMTDYAYLPLLHWRNR